MTAKLEKDKVRSMNMISELSDVVRTGVLPTWFARPVGGKTVSLVGTISDRHQAGNFVGKL
jgi:hypothetical protein